MNTWQSNPYRSFVPDIRLDATSSPVLLPHYLHTENTYILCHFILFYNFTQFQYRLYYFILFYNFTQLYCSLYYFTLLYNFTQLYCSLYYFTLFYYFLTFTTILGFSSFLYHLTPFYTKLDKPHNFIILNLRYAFTIFLHRNFYHLFFIRFSPVTYSYPTFDFVHNDN